VQIEAALIREQGVDFAVVAVRPSALTSADRDRAVASFSKLLGAPVVLLAPDSRGGGRTYGRPDLVRFLKNVPVAALPWKRLSVH